MKAFLLLTIALSALFAPTFGYALIDLNLDYPVFGPFDLNTDQELTEIIAFFYYFIVGISGLAAFVMLVWAGVQWLVSAGSPAQIGAARDRVKSAILGLLLILASVLIIQLINPELVVLKPPSLGSAGQGQDPVVESGPGIFKGPKGVTEEGIYLCREEECACVADPCVEGTDGNVLANDYVFINATSIPIFTGILDLETSVAPWFPLTNWHDKISAIGIIGDWGIKVNEDVSLSDFGVCFQTGIPKLRDYLAKEKPLKADQDWANEMHSLNFFSPADFNCQDPGITLIKDAVFPGLSHFEPSPAAYLFDKVEWGRQKNRTFWETYNYYWPEDITVNDKKGPGNDKGYNAGILKDLSLWITAAAVCGPAGDEQCAVRFFEHTDVTAPPDPSHQTICFVNSMPNLELYALPPASDLKFGIKKIRVIPLSECPPAIQAKVQG